MPEAGTAAQIASAVRILGIDPGSQRTGVGVLDALDDGRCRHVFHTALELTAAESFPLRLKQIFEQLGAIVDAWCPHEVAIERVFMARNADSALKLGQARGAAICAVVARGLTLTEYAPRAIKQAIVGSGSADKHQIQHMIGVLLSIDEQLQADAADALAVALAHAHTRATTERLGIPRAAWRRR